MNELLNGIKVGDFVEFDLVTSPVEVYRVDESKRRVRLFFRCRSGSWGLSYKRNGTQDECFEKTGIHSAFDIVNVIKK